MDNTAVAAVLVGLYEDFFTCRHESKMIFRLSTEGLASLRSVYARQSHLVLGVGAI